MHETNIYAIVHRRSYARNVGMILPHGWGPTLAESVSGSGRSHALSPSFSVYTPTTFNVLDYQVLITYQVIIKIKTLNSLL